MFLKSMQSPHDSPPCIMLTQCLHISETENPKSDRLSVLMVILNNGVCSFTTPVLGICPTILHFTLQTGYHQKIITLVKTCMILVSHFLDIFPVPPPQFQHNYFVMHFDKNCSISQSSIATQYKEQIAKKYNLISFLISKKNLYL